MKKLLPGILLFLTVGLAGTLHAQPGDALPASVYEGLPFEMKKVEQPHFARYTVSITDFGAVPDGKTLNTEAINNAIASVSRQGGGRVVIPSGYWVTGPIRLQSGVELHTEKNAFILFSEDHSLYKKEGAKKGEPSLSPISADHADNIAITGDGIFDGNGDTWRMVKRSKLTAGQWKERVTSGGVVNEAGDVWYPSQAAMEGEGRPNMVRLFECNRVLLQGVTFRNSPAWCIHPIHCEDLTLHQVSVINPWYSQNGDALDVESCDRVVIYDCTFDAGDDAICIKSGKDKAGRERGWPCQNVIARNNVVYHGHGGFVVGSEMSGGVKNIFIDNCTFIGTDVGIRFKSTRGRGGVVENIYCRNINMFDIANENILFDLYYGVKNKDNRPVAVDEGTPQFRNIYIANVKAIGGRCAMLFNGLPEMPVKNIALKNISISGSTTGAIIRQSENIIMDNVVITPKEGDAVVWEQVKNVTFNGKKIKPVGEKTEIISK